jgi:uncharacterized protein YabN with tetrapyrrole methylase and pyrophosphatase domain
VSSSEIRKAGNPHRKHIPRVTVVGIGIGDLAGATYSAISRLRQSQIVFTLLPLQVLRSLGLGNIRSLARECRGRRKNSAYYRAICAKVLDYAKEYGNVAVALRGHPRVGVSVVTLLEELARKGLIRLEVIPGLSSFDAMLSLLQRDALERGSALVHANALLAYDLKLDPVLDCYIYCIASMTKVNQLKLFTQKLLTLYPADHKAKLIRVGMDGNKSEIATVRLRDLSNLRNRISSNTTLFIPGIKLTSQSRRRTNSCS